MAANTANGLEEGCVGCSQSPLDVSLVLSCNHRLCLDCAACGLRSIGNNEHTAICPSCSSVTDVDPTAAQHLREHLATVPQDVGRDVAPAVSYPAQRPLPSIQIPKPVSPTPQNQANMSAFDRMDRNHDGVISRAEFAAAISPQAFDDPVVAAKVCGQCEMRQAAIDCWQCGEKFCAECSAVVHRAGRMKEHRLTALTGSKRDSAPAVSTVSFASTPSRSIAQRPSSPTDSIGVASVGTGTGPVMQQAGPGAISLAARCPAHPDEPLQFFCMDCESECICAECAVEAAHKGRDVKSVRKAYAALNGHIDDTLESLSGRHEGQYKLRNEADGLKMDLNTVIAQGKESIQEAFRQLRTRLSQKEAELISGIDTCEKATVQMLSGHINPATTHTLALRDAHTALQKVDTNGDEVKALNMFASAKVVVNRLTDPMTGVDGTAVVKLMDELGSELRNSLHLQVENVQSLGARVGSIRRATGPTASGSPRSPIST